MTISARTQDKWTPLRNEAEYLAWAKANQCEPYWNDDAPTAFPCMAMQSHGPSESEEAHYLYWKDAVAIAGDLAEAAFDDGETAYAPAGLESREDAIARSSEKEREKAEFYAALHAKQRAPEPAPAKTCGNCEHFGGARGKILSDGVTREIHRDCTAPASIPADWPPSIDGVSWSRTLMSERFDATNCPCHKPKE